MFQNCSSIGFGLSIIVQKRRICQPPLNWLISIGCERYCWQHSCANIYCPHLRHFGFRLYWFEWSREPVPIRFNSNLFNFHIWKKKMNSFECHLFQFLKFSKKSQFDCSSTKLTVSNTNVMPKLSTMNGHSETPAPSSVTPDYLQPTTNSSVNLSSNSSLNSSSVKSIASKSNDGTATDKKRKSLSSSRQKKFHRRFKQVAMDEEVINCMYFECIFFSFQFIKITD